MLGDLIAVAILFPVVGVITAIGTFAFGIRLLPRRKIGAVLVSASAAPLLILAIAIIQVRTAPQLPPPNDAAAMAGVGLLVLALVSLPIALLWSAALIALVLKLRIRKTGMRGKSPSSVGR